MQFCDVTGLQPTDAEISEAAAWLARINPREAMRRFSEAWAHVRSRPEAERGADFAAIFALSRAVRDRTGNKLLTKWIDEATDRARALGYEPDE